MNSELGSWGEEPPDENNISKAIERTVGKLSSLNGIRQQEKCDSYGWMANSVGQIAAKVKWTIKDDKGEVIDVADLAKRSAGHVCRLDGKATSHGDVHLDNVLVSDDREPYLIDFAITGAGHPCFDLVRLNAAIKYRAMRMLASESRIAEFIRATHVLGRTYAEVEREFSDLLTSAGNRVSARASIAVRSACLKLLNAYGGKLADYLAMEALVACHALTMIQPQAGLVRSSIRALASEVMAASQGTAT
jgi:thiamine kinase-like enzyme